MIKMIKIVKIDRDMAECYNFLRLVGAKSRNRQGLYREICYKQQNGHT